MPAMQEGLIPELGRSPGEGNGYPLQYSCLESSMARGGWPAIAHWVTKSWGHNWATNTLGFPGGASGKEQPANARDIRHMGSILGSGKSPGEGHGNPLQDSMTGEFHGQRSLVGYSAWSCKESGATEVT